MQLQNNYNNFSLV